MRFITSSIVQDYKLCDFTHWILSVHPSQPAFGSLLITLKRSAYIDKIQPEEAKELSLVFSRIQKLLNESFDCEHIRYVIPPHSGNIVYLEVLPVFKDSKEFEGNNLDKLRDALEPVTVEKVARHVYDVLSKKTIKQIIGYSTGVFDLFHVGHLNVLEQAKKNCDFHLVGVTTDEEVLRIKGKKPVIPYGERARIVEALSCVDKVIPESNVDKLKSWEIQKFDVVFKGDDWKGSEKWMALEEEFAKISVRVEYFPYTKGTSSTHLKDVLAKIIQS